LDLREINDLQGYKACVRLQHETWGRDFSDQVPASVLMIAQRTGGLVLGAFLRAELIGFAWGMAGWKGSKKIHWSDMLAVKKAFRNQGIGYRLKLRQREILKRRGVVEIHWTFDPLQSLNARFNFSKLGVLVSEYRPNLYGKTHSPLHASLDTDRFVAVWDLIRPMRRPRAARELRIEPFRVINPCIVQKQRLIPRRVRLDLPADDSKSGAAQLLYLEAVQNLASLKHTDPGLARLWQRCTREACLHYFDRGFVVRDFVDASIEDRRGMFYVLSRTPLNK